MLYCGLARATVLFNTQLRLFHERVRKKNDRDNNHADAWRMYIRMDGQQRASKRRRPGHLRRRPLQRYEPTTTAKRQRRLRGRRAPATGATENSAVVHPCPAADGRRPAYRPVSQQSTSFHRRGTRLLHEYTPRLPLSDIVSVMWTDGVRTRTLVSSSSAFSLTRVRPQHQHRR